MRLSNTAVVNRNELWMQGSVSEPYEAGWAETALIFVRALKPGLGAKGRAHVEISPDGMHWLREGTSFDLPFDQDEITYARVRDFGNWLRISAELDADCAVTVLVTLHLKA